MSLYYTSICTGRYYTWIWNITKKPQSQKCERRFEYPSQTISRREGLTALQDSVGEQLACSPRAPSVQPRGGVIPSHIEPMFRHNINTHNYYYNYLHHNRTCTNMKRCLNLYYSITQKLLGPNKLKFGVQIVYKFGPSICLFLYRDSKPFVSQWQPI